MTSTSAKPPIWFWLLSILMLLWNLSGVASFVYHVFFSEEAFAAMPEAEREIMINYPLFAKVAFAIAVFGGLMGCIGLLAKRKWAKPFFLASLIGIAIQITHDLFMTPMMEVYGNDALLMPVLILGFGLFLIWFSNYSIKKEWIH